MLEETQLFVRGIGEGTDIVHKEMYTFGDKKGRSLTLRPEMTAGVVRSFVEHGIAAAPDAGPGLWYTGPMFRYERPQKGRYRQFHQVGAEVFGVAGPEADAEMIAAIFAFLRRLRFDGLVLRLNSVGDAACRPAYVEELRRFSRRRGWDRLCADCVRRGSRRTRCGCSTARAAGGRGRREVAAELPSLPSRSLLARGPAASTPGGSRKCRRPRPAGRETDERLVRGLDYYTRTVFEISAGGLGAQDAIVGGGRYDRLVADLGGPERPGVGFAAGLDRILEVLPTLQRSWRCSTQVLVVPIGGATLSALQGRSRRRARPRGRAAARGDRRGARDGGRSATRA